MAGLLAADVEAVLAHVLEDVAIADWRALERQTKAAQMALKPEIGHDGPDHAGLSKTAILLEAFRDHGQELVTVDDMAALVGDQNAGGIAVAPDAGVTAHLAHLAAQSLRRGRAAVAVDVEPVGLDANRDHLGAELPERLRCDLVGGAMSAIDHHPQALEAHAARQRALGEFDVAALLVLDAPGTADFGALGQVLGQVGIDQRLDLVLDLVGELVAVRTEQLDAVVVKPLV